jgi:hypothetical protein
MSNKWLRKDGETLHRNIPDAQDSTREILRAVAEGRPQSEDELKALKRRKLVQQVTRKSFRVARGSQYRPRRVKRYADLTKDMLGSKEEVRFVVFYFTCTMYSCLEIYFMLTADGCWVPLE